MAQVVQTLNNPSTTDGVTSFFSWLVSSTGYIIFAVLLIICAIVIWYIFKKMEEERIERDDPIYEAYKNTLRDCELQKDNARINKSWSLVNLFWLGFPIVKKEHSKRVLNYTNDIIGYYRGHCKTMDGFLNLMLYKEKLFGMFETKFILKCPLQIKNKVNLQDDDGKVLVDEDGKPRQAIKVIDYNDYVKTQANGDIKVMCASIQKQSYFRYPVYVTNDGSVVDLRKDFHASLIDIGYDQMMSRIMSTGSQMVEKAMLHNPNVKFEQLSPEKTSVEKSD